MNYGSTNNDRIGIACSHQRKGCNSRILRPAFSFKLTSNSVTVDRVQVIAVFTILATYAALYYLWHNTHNGPRNGLSRAQTFLESGLNAIESCQIIKCAEPLSTILVYVNE